MLGKTAKVLSIDRTNENCFVELNLMLTKSLITYSYNPNRSNIYSHLESLSQNLYSSNGDNYLVVGDCNVSAEEASPKIFC